MIFLMKSTIDADSEGESQNYCSTLEGEVNGRQSSRMKTHLFTDIGVLY